LFGMGTDITGLEAQLMQLGLTAEQARSAAAANAGTIGVGAAAPGIQANLQGQQGQARMMGSMFGNLGSSIAGGEWSGLFGGGGGAALSGFGSAASGAGSALGLFSDSRLKTNVKRIGTLPNGLALYQWAWNSIAELLGIKDQPTIGVMAQEVQKVKPEAVIKGDDGYLRVNYSMVLGV